MHIAEKGIFVNLEKVDKIKKKKAAKRSHHFLPKYKITEKSFKQIVSSVAIDSLLL